mmetsp:Transcript_5769/g.13425  ORF Transcript_5769/g.13425 Transcript_5769/m.13425 type:complete len:265 (+) Transcript_5769:407-1201(+)
MLRSRLHLYLRPWHRLRLHVWRALHHARMVGIAIHLAWWYSAHAPVHWWAALHVTRLAPVQLRLQCIHLLIFLLELVPHFHDASLGLLLGSRQRMVLVLKSAILLVICPLRFAHPVELLLERRELLLKHFCRSLRLLGTLAVLSPSFLFGDQLVPEGSQLGAQHIHSLTFCVDVRIRPGGRLLSLRRLSACGPQLFLLERQARLILLCGHAAVCAAAKANTKAAVERNAKAGVPRHRSPALVRCQPLCDPTEAGRDIFLICGFG